MRRAGSDEDGHRPGPVLLRLVQGQELAVGGEQRRGLDECEVEAAADAYVSGLSVVEVDGWEGRASRRLDLELVETTALFAPDGEFLALYQPQEDGARAVAVFV